MIQIKVSYFTLVYKQSFRGQGLFKRLHKRCSFSHGASTYGVALGPAGIFGFLQVLTNTLREIHAADVQTFIFQCYLVLLSHIHLETQHLFIVQGSIGRCSSQWPRFYKDLWYYIRTAQFLLFNKCMYVHYICIQL